jgi:protein TonB
VFEDALLESGGRIKTHRAATTFASLLMQSALVGLLLLMPMIFTEALPVTRASDRIHAPASFGSRAERRTELVPAPSRRGTSEITRAGVLLAPSRIPREIANIVEDEPPSIGPTGAGIGVPNGLGDPDSPIHQTIGDILTSPPMVAPPVERTVVSDGVMRGFLINKVMPEYPRMARLTRVQGAVELHAVISREGAIEGLRVMSGPVQLRDAAVKAVRQWRYRPYLLNGRPVEVETQITVKFVLGNE